ncbi:MAG: radical SAM protein [Candidatus Bathyarchaeota archaeon]|nr:radical SAM protein [Candidatus Bathyarchaeota archaeon]
MNSRNSYENLLHADDTALEKALATARSISWKNFGKKIRFYAPSFIYYKTSHFCSSPTAFPSISVTGSSCALNCKHCGGKVLNTMIPAISPKDLINLCAELRRKGAVGCLISGGCLQDGSVPLGRFVDAIAKVKRDTGLTVVVHTGVVDLSMARKLREAGVDAALIDIIGSDETIREIYRLNVEVEDYDRSLRALHESGIPFVPHVLVGLHYGELRGEFQALKTILKYSPSAVIIIALMPIHGTHMENVDPPTPKDIVRVLATARLMMPRTPIVLGCMRPKGEHKVKTDTLAVRSGVNAIAFPAEETVRLAETLGLEVTFSSLCCSQIFEDIKRGEWSRQKV